MPATAMACSAVRVRAPSRAHVLGERLRARPRSAGPRAGSARCGGPSPSASRRGSSGRRPAAPTTYSVEPPPMSITTVSRSSLRPAVAPRNVSRASSSPGDRARVDAVLARSGSRGTLGRSRRRASRWSRRRRPARRRAGRSPRGSTAIASATRSMASSASRPVASTPWPRRVMVGAPLELDDLAVLTLGHQQPGRVGADVDDRDGH